MVFYFIKCLSDDTFYVGTNFRLDEDGDVSIVYLFSSDPKRGFLFTSKADAECHASEICYHSEIPVGIEIVSI